MSKMKESARKGTDVEGRKQRIDEGRGTGQLQNKDRETLGWRCAAEACSVAGSEPSRTEALGRILRMQRGSIPDPTSRGA